MTAGPPGPPEGRLRPLSAGVITATLVLGLIGGWLLRPAAERLSGSAPTVSWLQGGVLFFVAAILAATAWLTWRSVHVRRELLEPHRMVNRLVLARACAIMGAVVAGGYAGYALSWLGLSAELAGERIVRSGVAAVGGLVVLGMAIALERACRIRSDDPPA